MAVSAPKIQFCLTTDQGSTITYHCALCHYLHDAQYVDCPHRPPTRRAPSPMSDSSYYTAETSTSSTSSSDSNSIRAVIRPAMQARPPSLRRKTTTHGCSLRDLRKKQSIQWRIRTKESEEQLQRVYEAQIIAYLDSPFSTPATVVKQRSTHLKPTSQFPNTTGRYKRNL